LNRYLDNASALEYNASALESSRVGGLDDMARDAIYEKDRALFIQHKAEMQSQHDRLVAQLESRGGSPNSLKQFMNTAGFCSSLAVTTAPY
jgi:hypothetical protein